jgi:hypothetical protein
VYLFTGKTHQQITERWDKALNPWLVKGSWTWEEDEAIIDVVKHEGTKNWTSWQRNFQAESGNNAENGGETT